jgi:F-type H+-transporting ATPase subunit a
MIGTTGTGEAPTSRQAAGQEAGHAAGEASHGAEQAGQEAGHAVQEQAAHGGEHAEWGPDVMLHHVTDAQELDLGFVTFHLPEFAPLQVAGLTIDLSISKHVVFLFLAGLLTILTMWLAARQAQKLRQGEEAPGGLLNAMEAFYLYLRDEVALKNVGHGGERYVPFVISLFFFILYANLLGLVPFGATATGNIMVTGALAFVSFVVIEAAGYRTLGAKGYLGTIFFVPKGIHPVGQAILLPIFVVVEVVGKLTKPFALAMRLFANMTAGHFVILALLGLIITYGGIAPTGLTTIFGSLALGLFVMFLEIFVAFLQAYIFAILTAVFIGLIREH